MAAVRTIQGRVRRMGDVRFGFRIVITDERPDHVASPAAQARNVGVANQIFAMALMRLAIHKVSYVMKERADFKQHAHIGVHLVQRTKLVE